MLKKDSIEIETHIFIERTCGRLYRKAFQNISKAVLIRDGFIKVKNSAYPPDEPFSDLHLTYKDEGVTGFGDFLIVGDDYAEGGGPAYAVAIHVTYFKKNNDMNVRHFLSDRTNSPADPAGKFFEALKKLHDSIVDLDLTEALEEYNELYKKAHFPGLGVIKKLSMKHHVQLMMSFLK